MKIGPKTTGDHRDNNAENEDNDDDENNDPNCYPHLRFSWVQ